MKHRVNPDGSIVAEFATFRHVPLSDDSAKAKIEIAQALKRDEDAAEHTRLMRARSGGSATTAATKRAKNAEARRDMQSIKRAKPGLSNAAAARVYLQRNNHQWDALPDVDREREIRNLLRRVGPIAENRTRKPTHRKSPA